MNLLPTIAIGVNVWIRNCDVNSEPFNRVGLLENRNAINTITNGNVNSTVRLIMSSHQILTKFRWTFNAPYTTLDRNSVPDVTGCVFFIFLTSEASLESLVISNGDDDNTDNNVDDVVEKEGTDGENTRTLPLLHRLLLLSNVCCVVSYRVTDDEGSSVCLVGVIVENPLQ